MNWENKLLGKSIEAKICWGEKGIFSKRTPFIVYTYF